MGENSKLRLRLQDAGKAACGRDCKESDLKKRKEQKRAGISEGIL